MPIPPSIRPLVGLSVRRSVRQQFAKIDENRQTSLLDVSSHLYKNFLLRSCVCPSVRPLVGPSVHWSVRQQFAKIDKKRQTSLLDASLHLYERLRLSVRPSVGRSIRPSVGPSAVR